ncbi:hypothetical protein [Halosimplex marinum]
MATEDRPAADDDSTDREALVRRLFERDFERHREIYEKLEDE